LNCPTIQNEIMEQKSDTNTEQGHSANMLLVAVAAETQTEHGHKGLGSVGESSGICVGATSKPILFSAPMVKAILDGRKCQTRRVIKEALEWSDAWHVVKIKEEHMDGRQRYEMRRGTEYGTNFFKCPYGNVGDKLWVRETWWKKPFLTLKELKDGADTWPDFEYNVEPIMAWDETELKHYGWKKMPSIFMPREACRIELTITNIRAERLQSISVEDSLAEGITHNSMNDPRVEYQWLWEKINGRDSWASNPIVWVIEVKKNGVRPFFSLLGGM
jgi:hypothetical protein